MAIGGHNVHSNWDRHTTVHLVDTLYPVFGLKSVQLLAIYQQGYKPWKSIKNVHSVPILKTYLIFNSIFRTIILSYKITLSISLFFPFYSHAFPLQYCFCFCFLACEVFFCCNAFSQFGFILYDKFY